MNTISCSFAPNCAKLNRNSCYKKSQTCGNCLNGFIGTIGDSNDLCVNPNTLCIDGKCKTRTDRQLDEVNPSVLSKDCHGNCSNNGVCKFINVNSGVVLNRCLLLDPSCSAVCD
jgi:hypothetical protein